MVMPVPNIANPNGESFDSLLSQLIGLSDGTPDHFSYDNIFEFVLLTKLENGHQVLGRSRRSVDWVDGYILMKVSNA